MSIESAFISSVLRDNSITAALDANITAEFFKQERWNNAWAFIYDYYGRYGVVPSETTFVRQFPAAELEAESEPFPALLDELQRAHKRRLVMEGLQEAVDSFDEDHEGSLEAVQRMLSQVALSISTADVVGSGDFIGPSVLAAIDRKELHMIGLPTGFPTIDEATGGFQPEQLITLVGLPKAGKSSIALAVALTVQRYFQRVLYVSFEMSNIELQQRYLSIGAKVMLNHILGRGGSLTEREKQRLYEFEAEVLEMEAEGGTLILAHDINRMSTIGSIAAKIEQHSPALVVIDGAYMLTDELGEKQGSSQALTNITRGAKRLCQTHKVPIFLTTQGLFSCVMKSRGIELDSAGYSSSWAQDSDTILGLDRDDLEQPLARLKVVAARSALGVSCDIMLDYDNGDVSEAGGYSPRARRSDDDEDRYTT